MIPPRKSYRSYGVSDEKPIPTRKGDVGRCHATYRDAEAVGNFTVFNIKGNKYRLIISIDYEEQVIYYKYFLTHAEYDKEQWKNDPHY
jgi:mRNA-degrading endonuclease HigB of HigAB toxin-antitoxin module